jgi:hypothetical protein
VLTKFDKSKCQHRQEVGRKPAISELAISGRGAAKEFGLCEEASRSFQFFRAPHATLVIDESYQEKGVIFRHKGASRFQHISAIWRRSN